jgi:two-component system chemotaxis response regulator CheY
MFPLDTKILVVDDMATMRKFVIKVCTEMGFTDFVEASDGTKAWEIIASAKPPIGLIFSEWNMPNCTGIDLLKRLRSDSRFAKIPFLMVTAESGNQQITEAVRTGVNSYVIKPFNQATLAEKLESVHKRIIA